MRAMDIMTAEVITVTPTTSVQELAKLLSEHGISGVPVVDSDNQVVGVVSEGDLLHRAAEPNACVSNADHGGLRLWRRTWLAITSGRTPAPRRT